MLPSQALAESGSLYSLKILLPEALPSSALTFLHGGRIKGVFVYRCSDWGPLTPELQTNGPESRCNEGADEEDDGDGIEESCRKEIRLISGQNLGNKWESKCRSKANRNSNILLGMVARFFQGCIAAFGRESYFKSFVSLGWSGKEIIVAGSIKKKKTS